MRPRLELGVALALVAVLGGIAVALGARERPVADDPRRSTFVAGPQGASGYAEALERLGVGVERLTERIADSPRGAGAGAARDSTVLLAVLGPSDALDGTDAEALVRFSERGGDLLLAGRPAARAMRCFGYTTERGRDSVRLAPTGVREVVDSSQAADGRVTRCAVPSTLAVDTLRRRANGAPVALRLRLADGRAVTLVASDRLFSNRALRFTDAGPFALRLVVGRYRRVVFDEYHHGFRDSGSLAGALLAWSFRSPWGWAVWQLMLVGLVALVASGLRFGPIREVIERRRRSPLEHVRALATALSAARGHDVAIRLAIQGLRRRLARGPLGARAQGLRADPRPWLAVLAAHLGTPRAREAAATLLALSHPPQSPQGVLRAATVVEDVWEELTP
jgi:hypothetical protein